MKTGVILAGNATVQAAREVGITGVRIIESDGSELVAVRRSGLSPEQKRRLALYDNRTAELADWDAGVLASLAGELDLSALWEEDELTALLAHAQPPEVAFPAYDESAEEQVKWLTCPGAGTASRHERLRGQPQPGVGRGHRSPGSGCPDGDLPLCRRRRFLARLRHGRLPGTARRRVGRLCGADLPSQLPRCPAVRGRHRLPYL